MCTDGSNEIQEMISSHFVFWTWFLFLTQKTLIPVIIIDYQVSFTSIENIANFGAVFSVCNPGTNFKFNYLFFFGVIIGRCKNFRSLSCIVEQEFTSTGSYPFRKANIKSPHTQICLMNALVTHITITIVPVPVPVIMNIVTRECTHFSRAGPEIVIKSLRNSFCSFISNIIPPAEYEPSGHIYIADQTIAKMFNSFLNSHRTA